MKKGTPIRIGNGKNSFTGIFEGIKVCNTYTVSKNSDSEFEIESSKKEYWIRDDNHKQLMMVSKEEIFKI